ncbi:RNA polymerase sigma factor [Desertivirga brevis]|uniref:RNA polymerase sigma factor n=1 Tax=Desertivirga brevis TaxID=2810310 RepID=UPI001A97A8A2|nr:sigma-70 family RNA polymerase sigma factor [Pedobacter sp. SYSU D00873]
MRSKPIVKEPVNEDVKDEALLWKDFKQGDKDAYASLYSKYSSLLFRYGCKISPDREVVKDCMHDLFTELWKNKATLGSPASVKNYLVKSLRNKLVREIAKQAKFVSEDGLPDTNLGIVSSHELQLIYSQAKSEQERQLISAMRKLTNRQKEIIFLLYYNNLSPAEVASIMSISVRTIYNTTFSAIQLLKGELTAIVILAICKDLL